MSKYRIIPYFSVKYRIYILKTAVIFSESFVINCLYCQTTKFEIGKGSEEHVILSSIGGKKSSRNICCQKCNNELGDEIDKTLSEEFSFISNFINIKTGRNKPPKTIKNAGVMNGQVFDLKPGGTPHYSKIKFDQTVKDNTVQANFSARSPEEALRLMEQFAKSHGKTIDDLKNASVKDISDYNIPQVSATLSLGGDLFFRSIAKMMLTYLATLCDQSKLRDGSVNDLIDYITGKLSEKNTLSFDFNTEFPNKLIESEMYHQIFIWADPISKLVFCGLKLFRFINFSAVLSDSWEGGEIKRSHVIDPITGSSTDFEFNSNDLTVNQLVESMGYDKTQFKSAINDLISTIRNIQHENATDTAIEKAISSAFANQNFDDLTNENLHEFVETIINQFKAHVFKGEAIQGLSLEQLKQLK